MAQEKRLAAKGELAEYDKEIQALIDSGFAEEVIPRQDESAWYLSHHAVRREDKESTKLRVVFNSARKFQGVCLNDALHKGPDLTNTIVSCLLGFREEKIAFVGDVRKMFNQIRVREEDCRYHRFLWRCGDTESEMRTYEWKRVPFGDKPSPDLSTNALRFVAEQNREEFPRVWETVRSRTYVSVGGTG